MLSYYQCVCSPLRFWTKWFLWNSVWALCHWSFVPISFNAPFRRGVHSWSP